MEYHEAANFLFDLRRYPPRMELESTRQLLSFLGDPQEDLRVVQIAGSNGKGSVARMTESILRETGLDVGLYTSPELDDVRERVRVNGQKVSKRRVSEFVERLETYAHEQPPDGVQPTFFESTTALALWAFARSDVDVAVVEVGIGGRYDATSVATPEVSAVTSVTVEHADVLGSTIEEIARDMAAVEPADAPLVTGATGDALDAMRSATEALRTVGPDESADVRVIDHGRDGIEQVVDVESADQSIETKLPLLGSHQSRNAGIAVGLVQELTTASEPDIARGLRNAHWPGRFEVLDRSPLTIADGAHNPAGCAALAETLESFDHERLHLVFGAMIDKDHTGMVEALPTADAVYTCRPDVGRAEVPAVLAAEFRAADRADTVTECGSVASALALALENADPDDAVLVAGSLFTVAEARRRWTRTHRRRRIPDPETEKAVLASGDVPPADAERVQGRGVHHNVQLQVQPRQAAHIKEELLAAGGACAVSSLARHDRELVDIVLMGTRAQFRHLVDALEDRGLGLPRLANELQAAISSEKPDGGEYPWSDGTSIMGILNVTPDSFHDGGQYSTAELAIDRAEQMVSEGADIIDVGGESTRPGAEPVPIDEEIDRVVPVIESLAGIDAHVSIDTRKAEVARAALDAGADILNDVSGLADPEMRHVAAEYDVPVVVMHSINTPVDPDDEIEYDDVVADTLEALTERVLLAEKVGLDRSQIIVDPGLGFGKSPAESFELLDRLDEFHALGCPVLVGHSRKSMFGRIGREDTEDRLPATVATTALAAERGADIVRVHDVRENVAAVRTADAVETRD